MSDLDRYLTEEALEEALREFVKPRMVTNMSLDGTRAKLAAALSAALPEIIRQARAEALREMGDWFKLASDLGTGDRDLIAAQACYDRIEQGGQP